MRERNAGCCVVWSADDCTWIDGAGLCLDGDAPPRGEPIDARDYAHLPVRTETCVFVPLPRGSVAPFLCVVRASRDYVEICPGEPMLIACLDEPVASGEEDPAAGLIGLDGKLAAPARFRGCRVTEIRDDWNLYRPVQPSGAGIILRTPWPEDVRHAAETVAGQDLPEDLHRRIWNAVRPAASETVSTGAREAA